MNRKYGDKMWICNPYVAESAIRYVLRICKKCTHTKKIIIKSVARGSCMYCISSYVLLSTASKFWPFIKVHLFLP